MAIHRVPKKGNFTRIPNSILRDKRLSEKARGLLCRMLANKDDWRFSIEYLARTGKNGKESIATQLRELEKYGYLRRCKIRGEHGEFSWEYDVYEDPKLHSPDTEIPDMVNPDTVTPDRDSPDTGTHSQNNTIESHTIDNDYHINLSSSEGCSTYIPESRKPTRQVVTSDDLERCTDSVRNQINYDICLERYPDDQCIVDEVVNIMVETLTSTKPTVRVNSSNLAAEAVHNRLLSLNEMHIGYVIECLKSTTHEIKAPSSYLLTALYNAPYTMDTYYQSQERHDEAQRLANIH